MNEEELLCLGVEVICASEVLQYRRGRRRKKNTRNDSTFQGVLNTITWIFQTAPNASSVLKVIVGWVMDRTRCNAHDRQTVILNYPPRPFRGLCSALLSSAFRLTNDQPPPASSFLGFRLARAAQKFPVRESFAGIPFLPIPASVFSLFFLSPLQPPSPPPSGWLHSSLNPQHFIYITI